MTTFTTKFGPSQIDAAAGVIRGVCLIKKPVAIGHSLYIDDKTLQTVLSACKKKRNLKVKLDHSGSASAIIGSLSGYRIDGDCVRADLTLLKSSEYYNYIIELCERMPEEFGLSISFSPQVETIGGMDYVRCQSISSADVVSDPAATTGIFSAPLAGANTATAIPTGVKPKTRTINVVCPNCEKHLETFNKLASLHSSAADKLDALCDSLEPKDNVSSVPTEQQFQARLEAQKIELEKGLEKRASIMAQRLLASTGVRLSKIPDPDVVSFATSGDGILDQLEKITDATEKGRFYQRHKDAIQAAFSRLGAKSIELQNRLTANAGIE